MRVDAILSRVVLGNIDDQSISPASATRRLEIKRGPIPALSLIHIFVGAGSTNHAPAAKARRCADDIATAIHEPITQVVILYVWSSIKRSVLSEQKLQISKHL